MATQNTIPDISRAARQRRQEAWERGAAWCQGEHLVKRALAAVQETQWASEEEQYLFLLGIANTLTAAGRDIAGIDRRKDD
jgi:hypothetical protein